MQQSISTIGLDIAKSVLSSAAVAHITIDCIGRAPKGWLAPILATASFCAQTSRDPLLNKCHAVCDLYA